MASSTRHICRSLQRISRNSSSRQWALQIPPVQICIRRIQPFSCGPPRRADDPASTSKRSAHWTDSNKSSSSSSAQAAEQLDETEYLTPAESYTANDLSPQERADYEVLTKPEQVKYLQLQNHVKALLESGQSEEEFEALADEADRQIEQEGSRVAIDFPTNRAKGFAEVGYWAEDEEDEFGKMEDADDDWSDEYISSVAESELDLHRDIREYTRIAAWDLPLLQQYAKPFQPPNHSTPLRFRYTTYMGETHPASRKVVVELCTKDLLQHPSTTYKISESQRSKLIKLAGVRYNPDTDVLKMSSEKFETAAQNKRHLGDLVGTLIREAKDKRDEFKDVPFDFRHHKSKKEIHFPEEWKLNANRTQEIAAYRKLAMLPGSGSTSTSTTGDGDGDVEGEPITIPIVDGKRLVEQYVRIGAASQLQSQAQAQAQSQSQSQSRLLR